MGMRPLLIALLALGPGMALGQQVESGLLPSLNINKKLPSDWSLNLRLESRQQLLNSEEGGWGYEYLLSDIALAGAKKIGGNTTVAGGYLMRVRPGANAHRLFQQITWVRRYTGITLGHRLSTDQTFGEGEASTWRLRYRLASEIPLSGQTLDAGELFLRLGNEYLNALEAGQYDLEVRGLLFLGYALGSNSKLELGLDYRLDGFVGGEPENVFWTGLNYFISLR